MCAIFGLIDYRKIFTATQRECFISVLALECEIRGTDATGFKGAYVAVLIGGNTFKWRFIERDEEIISALIQLEADFRECVKNDVPPSLDGSDVSAKFLAEKFSRAPKRKSTCPMKPAILSRNICPQAGN